MEIIIKVYGKSCVIDGTKIKNDITDRRLVKLSKEHITSSDYCILDLSHVRRCNFIRFDVAFSCCNLILDIGGTLEIKLNYTKWFVDDAYRNMYDLKDYLDKNGFDTSDFSKQIAYAKMAENDIIKLKFTKTAHGRHTLIQLGFYEDVKKCLESN